MSWKLQKKEQTLPVYEEEGATALIQIDMLRSGEACRRDSYDMRL